MSVPTKSALKKALKKNYITVNGKIATTATLIKGGETIVLTVPEDTSTNKRLVFPLKVLYEDNYLAIIHKPAGILVSGMPCHKIYNKVRLQMLPNHNRCIG